VRILIFFAPTRSHFGSVIDELKAAMPMKRPAQASPLSTPKVVKAPKTAQPWDSIVKVLRDRSSVDIDVLDMIQTSFPHTLGVPKNQRHCFQEKVLAIVEKELSGIEERLFKSLQECDGKVAATDVERARLVDAIQQQQSVYAARTAENDKHKLLLKTLEETTAANAAELEKKRLDVVMGDDAQLNATSRQAKLREHLETFAVLKDAEPEPSKIAAFVDLLNGFNLDVSLLTSAKIALAKSSGARGTFDGVTLEHLDMELHRAIQTHGDLAAGHGKEARIAAVEAAMKGLADAEDKRDDCIIAESTSRSAVEAAHETLAATQAALAKLERDASDTTLFREVSSSQLELFRGGPLSLFRRLRHSDPEVPVSDVPVSEVSGAAPLTAA